MLALVALTLLGMDPKKPEDVPLALIEDLKAGRADAAHARLGPSAGAIPPQTLLASWQTTVDGLGAIGRIERLSVVEQKGLMVYAHAVHFAAGAVQVTTAVDPKTLKAEGFWLKPMPGTRSADYVTPDTFTAFDVTVGKEPWALPATITLPKGAGPFPAVVLVHGSGPNDRDETIGANKPFRDLAEGLSSRGIAVLRYDKRTMMYGPKMTGVVKLDDEVVLDALAGLELLAARADIDPKRLFVVGHSLGAQLAPEIAARSKVAVGAVLLAPPARKVCETVIAQLAHTGSSLPLLEEVKRQCAAMKAGKATGSLLGAPVEYWMELEGKDGIAAAKKLGKRLLVLHGERDYQVDTTDAAAWKKGLQGVKGVELVVVPKANHLFIEGEGISMPAEYGRPGHVAPTVIDKIVAFTIR
jgi:dienelactone hydrolase